MKGGGVCNITIFDPFDAYNPLKYLIKITLYLSFILNFIKSFKQALFFTYIIITIPNALYFCLSISNTIMKIEKNAKKQNIKNVLKSLGKSTAVLGSIFMSHLLMLTSIFSEIFLSLFLLITYQRPMAILYFAFFCKWHFFCPLTFANFLLRTPKFF